MRFLALAICGGCLACGSGAPPVFNDEIGVQAIPAEPGSHAGVFALKTVNTTLVHVPVLGDYAGGGTNFRLVVRSWDDEAGVYRQRSRLCGGFNFEVASVTTAVADQSYRAVPESIEELVDVDHEAGTYGSSGHLQLWGLRNLAEPRTAPLPTTPEEAMTPPFSDRIYDMDEDTHPGVTVVVSGAFEGEMYIIQRKTVELEGVILGPDRALGLARNTNEVLQIGNNNPLLSQQNDGAAEPHPDPLRSYFEEARLPDNADCDDVMRAEDDGVLSRLRPF